MTYTLFGALALFAAIGAYTPGPNNTVVLSIGANYGFRAAIPMILGIGLGFPFLIFCVGLGLGQVFETFPQLSLLIKVLGAGYMLWLAWKIATSKPSSDGDETTKPFTFLQGCAFQWVNPKAWLLAISALSTYALPSHFYAGLAAVVGTFIFMGLTSAATWTVFGTLLRSVMNDARYYKIINVSLALLLLVSLVPMLQH